VTGNKRTKCKLSITAAQVSSSWGEALRPGCGHCPAHSLFGREQCCAEQAAIAFLVSATKQERIPSPERVTSIARFWASAPQERRKISRKGKILIPHRTGCVAANRASQILALQHFWTNDQRVLRTIPFPEGVRGDEDRIGESAILVETEKHILFAPSATPESPLAFRTGYYPTCA